MRRKIPLLAAVFAVAIPANSLAAVAHTVQPGETLWSIAAASNLTNRALAAYNGLSETSNVILGSTIMVPSEAEAAAAMAAAGIAPGAPAAPAETTTPAAAPASTAPAPLGGYTVRWGDTLSGLAATTGVGVDQIAAMNGLDPSAVLPAGTVLKLPTGAPTPPRADEPAPEAVVPAADPVPTSTRVDAGTVQSIAAEHGVSPSLAAAIGWQESGFNNAMVSSANARGVMQVMPGTWDWIQQNLTDQPLDPASATDNVRAGVLYLRHLLDQTGGDESTAVAGYYQGLGAVRSRGLFPETEQYVANVNALRSRFGG